jgi:hypothetical protein
MSMSIVKTDHDSSSPGSEFPPDIAQLGIKIHSSVSLSDIQPLVYSPQRGSMRENYLHGGERQEYIHI